MMSLRPTRLLVCLFVCLLAAVGSYSCKKRAIDRHADDHDDDDDDEMREE